MKRHLASFLSFLKTKKFPTTEDIATLRHSPVSLYTGGLFILLTLVVGLFLALLMHLSALVSTDVPDYGGSITEGVIGAPRFINPLLATSETDEVLTTLIYSGLISRADDGSVTPALATSCTASPDARSYQCTLPPHLVFSNKHPLTSADVLFTLQTKKLLALSKDPYSIWGNVSVEAPDATTVRVTTTGNPTDLIDILTTGIVPKELWEPIPLASLADSAANMAPIGAGPFTLTNISYTNTIPTEITLTRNKHFAGPKPFLHSIIVHSYANQLDLKAALHQQSIMSTSALKGTYIDTQIENDFSITPIATTKSVALLVNQTQATSTMAQSLAAVGATIDKKAIIDTIEHGYGIPLSLESTSRSNSAVPLSRTPALPISIAVQKDEDLIATAELLSTTLKEFGILSTVNVFDQGLFSDQLQLKAYPFVLVATDTAIAGYQRLIPLYTKTIPHISEVSLHTPTPQTVSGLAAIFRDTQGWYRRTDRVWNWFTLK